jgi:hypothetical protein
MMSTRNSNSDILQERTILITGATDGIGKQTALQLVGMGARVLLHDNDRQRLENTRRQIHQMTGHNNLGLYQADLSKFVEVKMMVQELLAQEAKLDVPSQNGLFCDLPHLQRVTRFRISNRLPSVDSIGMPTRTQRGPCSPLGGYSITTMDFLNSGYIAFPLSLFVITSRPDGQLHASSMAVFLASWSSDCLTRFQIPPVRMLNLAWTQRCPATRESTKKSQQTITSYGWLRFAKRILSTCL